jgi:uncharacterized protein YbjQ (UPF0145 family)
MTIPDVRSPYLKYHGVVDYSKYMSRGFFITEANSVSFDYESIGSVTAGVESGWEILDTTTKTTTSKDDVYGSSTKTKIKYGEYIQAELDDAIEELYSTSIELGADGVINFSIRSSLGEYVVSGMAIKRK